MIMAAKLALASGLLAGYASRETLDPATYSPTLPLVKVEGSHVCTAVEVMEASPNTGRTRPSSGAGMDGRRVQGETTEANSHPAATDQAPLRLTE
jgi:hypothetical protein